MLEDDTLKNKGEVLITSDYQNLSDEDAEFYVQVRNHIYEDGVTLEFLI